MRKALISTMLCLIGFMGLISAISCGDNICEESVFDLTNSNPTKTIEINGFSETFTYTLIEEDIGENKRIYPQLSINGKVYEGSYDPLYGEKGYYPSIETIYNRLNDSEKPTGIKVFITESFYCKATDCRKKQSVINVEKGWNLVQQYQIWFQDFSQTTCNFNQDGAGFFYNPFTKNYMQTRFSSTDAVESNVWNHDGFGFSNDEYFEKLGSYQFTGDMNSFWVYSKEQCKIVINYPDYYASLTPPDSLQLFSENRNGNSRKIVEGWNFLSVYTLLSGNSLNEIEGDCSFEKSYSFDSVNQRWLDVPLDYKFSSDEIGKGLIVKNSFECTPNFRIGSSSIVPPLPN